MSNIITISREFGSGGRELGKRLADEMGYTYYDRQIISLLAEETNMSEEYIHNISEQGIYPIGYSKVRSFQSYPAYQKKQIDLLVAERNIIQRIAKEGNCIIVGRCAGDVLIDENPMNIFVYSDMETKIQRCLEKAELDEGLSDKEMKKKINEVESRRKRYHDLIGRGEWKDPANFHLCINTSNTEIEKLIKPLADYIKVYKNWRE